MQSLVGLLLIGRAWLLCHILLNYALQAACSLFTLFPTICTIIQLFTTTTYYSSQLFPTIPNYLHYSQLFALFSTNHNYCSQLFQLFALFPTIQFRSTSNRQAVVGMPCVGRPWLAFQFPADLGCETDDWHSLNALLFFGRAWLVCY